MKYALKAVPGLPDVGVPHGGEDGPRTPAPGSGSKITVYHLDQHEKLKEWNGNGPLKGQIGLEEPGQMCFSI